MISDCGGLGWGNLEGSFIQSLMPILQLIIPVAHLMTHVLFLRRAKRERELESLSILRR
jgi:hypothetical protein